MNKRMREKSRKIALAKFNPNGVGLSTHGIFGLPFTSTNAEIIVLGAPWNVTVSAGVGTIHGPKRILEASLQIDLYNETYPDFWKAGISMVKIPGMKKLSVVVRKETEKYIRFITHGGRVNNNLYMESIQHVIDEKCRAVNASIKEKALQFLENGQMVCLVGGDHSTSLGLLQAQSEIHEEFGILHIDAHADLRKAYEGLQFSHGSVMFNALSINQVKKIVQVGVRDYCKEETDRIAVESKLMMFPWKKMAYRMFEGETSWEGICNEIIDSLPSKVYVSFDIDGLDPSCCPNTGTPVPGGLSYDQVVYLLQQLHKKKTIIGCDLVEVGNHPWDANVGARLLYELCMFMYKSLV